MDRARIVSGVAIELGRGQWGFLLRLGALIFVPLALLGTLDESVLDIDDGTSVSGALLILTSVLTLTATSLLGNLLFAGALATAVAESADGRAPSVRGIIRSALVVVLRRGDVRGRRGRCPGCCRWGRQDPGQRTPGADGNVDGFGTTVHR